MKRAIVVTAVLLSGVLCVQAAAAKPQPHVAGVSNCIARQRAMLAPLDRYGGNLPPSAPALMQQIMGPVLHTIRTRCLPAYHGPASVEWNDPASIAPPAPYQPSANNPSCPGSIC